MHLATQPEESAEAHDQPAPAHRIDTRPSLPPEGFVDVQFHDVHLEQPWRSGSREDGNPGRCPPFEPEPHRHAK